MDRCDGKSVEEDIETLFQVIDKLGNILPEKIHLLHEKALEDLRNEFRPTDLHIDNNLNTIEVSLVKDFLGKINEIQKVDGEIS